MEKKRMPLQHKILFGYMKSSTAYVYAAATKQKIGVAPSMPV